ncbi:MAG: VWA domain-containing protein [Parachlamydiaceae bacterium]|nr:VWA domain-containing protein [Parachlamydiaceae bacterium]
MIPFDFHYLYPQVAYLIVLSFIAMFLLWHLYRFRGKLRFSPEMIQPRSFVIFVIKVCCAGTALALCVFALMQPVGNGRYLKVRLSDQKSQNLSTQPIELKRKAHDIIFMVDASASMGVKDARLQKSRFEYAKVIADEIISTLTGETVALYAFTSKIAELSPLTLDYIYVRLALKAMQINEGDVTGTSITGAQAEIRKKYFSSTEPDEESNRLRTIILLSDGGDTEIEVLSAAEKNKAIEAAAKLVQDAGQHHLRIYTIGMGSGKGGIVPDVTDEGKPVQSKLERALLEAIAKNGRGKYFEANRYTPGQLAKEVLADIAQDPPYYDEKPQEIQEALLQSLLGSSKLIYDRYFQVPLGIGLIALAFILFFPERLKKNFLLLLFWIVPIMAQEDVDSPDMLRAQGYVEAHMYEQARAIYERMLISPLPDFQEAALRYDVGSTYLLGHDWEQAITHYNDVITKFDISQADSAPWKLLKKRIYRNLALAYYEKALTISNEEALNALNKALEINARLPNQEREPLETYAKRTIALKRLSNEKKNQDKSVFQGISNLLDGLEAAQEGLHFLEFRLMSADHKSNYSALFAKEINAWIPVWSEQGKKMESSSCLSLFQKASGLYKLMVEETNKENLNAALNAASNTEKALNILLMQISGENASHFYLRRLLNFYQRLSSRKIWSKKLIERITQGYDDLKKLDLDKILLSELEQSEQSFQEAIKAYKANKLQLSNLFQEDGLQWIKLALSRSQSPIKSINLLINLLQQQMYAENQLQRYQAIQNAQELSSKFEQIVKSSQSEVQILATLFYSQVFEEQEEAYHKDRICQATPWGEALPLFDEGMQLASQANSLLGSSIKEVDQVLSLQGHVIGKWEKALAEIKNPTTKHSSCHTEETKDSGSTSQLESLNTLLKMDADDRQPSKPFSGQSGGVRSW